MDKHKHVIVIVCRGNVARSPFAAAVIKQELRNRHLEDSVDVLSRGIQGSLVDPQPVKYPNITYYRSKYEPLRGLFSELHVDLRDHQATTVDQNTVDKASVLLAMDDKTADGLRSLFPDSTGKLRLFSELGKSLGSIPDPEFASGKDSVQIFLDIRAQIIAGFPKLLQMAHAA